MLGPLTGGFLLEHFYWGSVFLVNIPIVVVGVLAGVFLIPTSKDPSAPRLDPVGAVLSIVGLVVAALRDHRGAAGRLDRSARSSAFFVVGVALLGAFFAVGVAHRPPDARRAGSSRTRGSPPRAPAITLVFFAMFGSMFLLTQYFQFVLGYSPLETGIRFLPFAAMHDDRVAAQRAARASASAPSSWSPPGSTLRHARAGARCATLTRRQPLLARHRLAHGADGRRAWRSRWRRRPSRSWARCRSAKAGVGSAVNDTTRQVGGALGVAVIGSVLVVDLRVADRRLPRGQAGAQAAPPSELKQSLGLALAAGEQVPGLADTAIDAFVDGMHAGVLVAAGVALRRRGHRLRVAPGPRQLRRTRRDGRRPRRRRYHRGRW